MQITAYTSGDAKWYFDHVPVTPGQTYVFSDYYQANIASSVTVEYKLSTGKFAYVALKSLPVASVWTQYSGSFIPPVNSVTASVFHYINKVGYLSTDNFTFSPLA